MAMPAEMSAILVAHALSTPTLPTLPPISLSLPPSSVLVIRGPSGIGKSVLLKLISQLIAPSPTSSVTLHGHPPSHYSIPVWRSRVLYIPQRPALLPNTPTEFWTIVKSYSKLSDNDLGDPIDVAEDWGVGRELWEREWATLSGGEGQRIALAIGVSLRPDVLLLDEPTSALDHATALLVEATLAKPLQRTGVKQAILWVTHDDEQERRVADLVLEIKRAEDGLPGGGEVRIPVSSS